MGVKIHRILFQQVNHNNKTQVFLYSTNPNIKVNAGLQKALFCPSPNSMANLHFTHAHPLVTSNSGNCEFLCDGCKTPGVGKRYRCKKCDFNLHDYCGTCPRTLSSFMHRHPLTLVLRKPASAAQTGRVNRIFCDVCRDRVKGLYYRCKECEFHVHPLCTQLPKKLNHALHKIHPLILQSSPRAGPCAVCRRSCDRWRYRCCICKFDIHLDCVLEPVVAYQLHNHNGQRGIPVNGQNTGIPFQTPPQFAPLYRYPYGPGYPNFRPGFNIYQGGPCMYSPGNFAPRVQAQNLPAGATNDSGKKSMFRLVTRLGLGVVSNMVFGVDVIGLFAG